MGYNKIPLALKFNDDTGNAEGLIEFQLNVSDIGDICEDDYNPQTGDVLTYNPALDCWTASAPPAVAAGALSALTDVCEDTPSDYQALVWNGSAWCPSTIPTGGGGGGGVTSVNGDTGPTVDLYLSSLSGIAFNELGGGSGEGDGLLPQHLQWNGTNWVNAYEDEQYIRVKNRSGSELKAGQVVHIFNFQGDQAEVSLARADSPDTMPSIGVIYANILTDETGLAVTFGTADVDNSLTIDGSPNVGDVLYVSPTTSGSLTATKPTGSSHLIQNVGVLLKAAPGAKVKVTGVGRANDIPNTLTLGATTITSASAKFADVQDHSVMITDGTSAVSSLSGASGSIVYFEGATPAPGLQQIGQIMQNAGERVEDHNIEDLANVSQGETPGWPNGCILQYDEDVAAFVSAAIPGIDATDSGSVSIKIDHGAGLSGLGDDDHTQYVLADGTRAISGTLSAIQNDTGLDTVYLYTDASGSEAAPVLTFQRDSDNPDDGDYLGQIKFSGKNSNNVDELYAKITGKTSDVTLGTEDGLIEIAVKNAGSNLITTRFTGDALKLINGNGLEVEGTLDVTGAASLSSATVATTPTAATDVANKSYVDSQVTTPSYFQALASGTLTLTVNATEYDLGWSTSGTYAITDPAGNLEVQDGDSQGNNINVSGDGVYQIDCSVQTTNTTNGGRVGAIIRIYRDTGDGHGFAEISELRASNYASRGIENIVTGTTHLNTLISLNDGDKLKFTIMRNTLTGTPNVTSNGTYLRIIKIA